jgi:hypothetical protein
MNPESVLLHQHPESLPQGAGIALEGLTAWGPHSIEGSAGSIEFGR